MVTKLRQPEMERPHEDSRDQDTQAEDTSEEGSEMRRASDIRPVLGFRKFLWPTTGQGKQEE